MVMPSNAAIKAMMDLKVAISKHMNWASYAAMNGHKHMDELLQPQQPTATTEAY